MMCVVERKLRGISLRLAGPRRPYRGDAMPPTLCHSSAACPFIAQRPPDVSAGSYWAAITRPISLAKRVSLPNDSVRNHTSRSRLPARAATLRALVGSRLTFGNRML
jgi:hypothetical protein